MSRKTNKFQCRKCGCKRLEEVMVGVTQSTAIEGVDKDGLVYGHSSTDGGEIDHFQCLECGEVVRDGNGLTIVSPETLMEWLEAQGVTFPVCLTPAKSVAAGECPVPPLVAKPLSAAQVKKLAKDGRLTVRILLNIDELSVGRDCLNDAVSEMVAGDTTALEDISFQPVGVKDGSVIVEVTGSVANWLRQED